MVYYTVYRTYRVKPLKTNDTLILLVFIFMKKSVITILILKWNRHDIIMYNIVYKSTVGLHSLRYWLVDIFIYLKAKRIEFIKIIQNIVYLYGTN